ncbi:hypothetical protein Pmani_035940 [Petrolisthes manimaculis]|uniref:Uncharacterized protein n=1 Tax=Petrolisthes manimaculis TaxID=1843537 RepID=A0AAE1NLD5_9EUCA|nr:hypothetical protein Pmani_035940 [Petrolisthes manimaculis]
MRKGLLLRGVKPEVVRINLRPVRKGVSVARSGCDGERNEERSIVRSGYDSERNEEGSVVRSISSGGGDGSDGGNGSELWRCRESHTLQKGQHNVWGKGTHHTAQSPPSLPPPP